MKTRKELLDEATKHLSTQRPNDARLSAELLLAYVLHSDRTALIRESQETVSADDRAKFEKLVQKRGEGEPIAYLVGEKEFFSLPFYVDRAVLIPRPETEMLVEAVLEKLTPRAAGRFVDVGTGSGAIAITIKKHLPNWEIFGSDVQEESLAVARKNALRHGVEVHWRQSDLLKDVEGMFDAVAANLPYIPTKDVPHLAIGVRYEPWCALDGGVDGLRLIDRAVRELRPRLLRGGWLFLETGNAQEDEVRNLLQTAGYTVESIRNDYQGIPRVVVARWD